MKKKQISAKIQINHITKLADMSARKKWELINGLIETIDLSPFVPEKTEKCMLSLSEASVQKLMAIPKGVRSHVLNQLFEMI